MARLVRRRSRTPSAEALLGPLEYAAMSALWTESPASVNVVLKRINARRDDGDQLAYTTVMTVLGRLHDKGLLDRVKAGRGYDYTPRFSEPALIEHLGRQQVDELVDRFGAVALTQFAAALRDRDPALLDQLTQLAARERPDGV